MPEINLGYAYQVKLFWRVIDSLLEFDGAKANPVSNPDRGSLK